MEPALSPEQTILWDQSSGGTNIGVNSQDFEAANDDQDSVGADDFVVPADTRWVVESLDVFGNYSGPGPAESVDVTFHADQATFPGTALCEYSALTPTDDLEGIFLIDLPAPCDLDAGTYWVSVQSNQNSQTNGFWAFELVSAQTGNGGAWQNPLDGWGTGCTSWDRVADCWNSSFPDFRFRIEGGAVADVLFADTFQDGVFPSNWTINRGTWEESGGSLNGVPDDLIGDEIKALIIADPAFSGCSVCTVRGRLLAKNSFGLPAEIHVRLQARNPTQGTHFSVTLKPAQDKVVIRQKEGPVTLQREDVDFVLNENQLYEVEMTFDGTTFSVSIDGAPVGQPQTSGFSETPSGTVGFESRNADIEAHDVLVTE